MAKKGFRVAMAPNNVQVGDFFRFAGASRYVFNWGLAEWQAQYKAGSKPSEYALKKQFNATKDEHSPWIRQIPYSVTEAAFRDLGNAFKHFFRRVKNGETPGYPKFKNRYGKKSFALRGFKVELNRIKLTKIGWVRLQEKAYLPHHSLAGIYVAVSEYAGRWFAAAQADFEPPIVATNNLIIGIDLGIKTRAVLSNGKVFDAPNAFREFEATVSRLNRELSRRTKGGSNWRKTKLKLQRMHAKIAQVRKHWHHEISHYVTLELKPSVIVLEDLNVMGMVKNHCLAKSLIDASFGELRRQIAYKAEWLGIDVIIADRWFPSSKTCSRCGCIKDKLGLGERTYNCAECGFVIDRDLNAANNLAALGKR